MDRNLKAAESGGSVVYSRATSTFGLGKPSTRVPSAPDLLIALPDRLCIVTSVRRAFKRKLILRPRDSIPCPLWMERGSQRKFDLDRFARLPYRKLSRTLARMRSLRLVLAVAATLALTLCAIGIGLASQPRATSSELLNQRGSYVQDSYNTRSLCFDRASGTYYCTALRRVTAGSTLVTHHAIRATKQVAGKGNSAFVHAPTRVSHPANPPAPSGGGSVQDQIRAVFGGYANAALAVAACESGDNPRAYNASSGASGVFQFLASTWATTSYAGYSRFDAWANIHAAYQVFSRDGHSWHEWQCQP